jgi:hypothetical protein
MDAVGAMEGVASLPVALTGIATGQGFAVGTVTVGVTLVRTFEVRVGDSAVAAVGVAHYAVAAAALDHGQVAHAALAHAAVGDAALDHVDETMAALDHVGGRQE